MKTLVILASQNKKSFNNAIKDKVMEILKEKNQEVVLRDLYDLNFNPVLTSEDQQKNYNGNPPEDIKTEQDYIKWADKIIVINPVWWTGMPAILKGYIDRVFSYGFGYKFDKTGLVKLLRGKEVLIFNTTGQPKEIYEKGMYQAINMTTDTGIYDFVGIRVYKHIYFSSITSASEEERTSYLKQVENDVINFIQ